MVHKERHKISFLMVKKGDFAHLTLLTIIFIMLIIERKNKRNTILLIQLVFFVLYLFIKCFLY